jgi:predicted transcriptional regulator
MQQMLPIEQIKQRSEALGISLKRLARAAGVNPSTAYRGANGESDTLGSTLRKLTAELLRHESRVREHIGGISRGDVEDAA